MWHSKHLFIHDFGLIDRFLSGHLFSVIDAVTPDQWFFIRYWQGGAHIRLRYRFEDPVRKKRFDSLLSDRLEAFGKDHADHPFREVSYDKRIVDLEGVNNLEVYPNFSIRDISYGPEWERYGGREAMGHSEQLFHRSSEMAKTIIDSLEWPKRYVVAFDLMQYSFMIAEKIGMTRSEEDFFSAYHRVWESFGAGARHEAVRNALEKRMKQNRDRQEVPEVYRDYLADLESAMRRILDIQNTYREEDVHYLMVSHIHMLNNRLGISPENEHFLSGIFLAKGAAAV